MAEYQESVKVYPSKRVKNHAAAKLRKIFGIKGKIILKHSPSIFYTGDHCYGLCFTEGFPEKAIHRIVIAENANQDMKTYLSTLMHEYVHAWQFENGYPVGHNKKSGFTLWQEFLKMRYKVII